MIAAIRADRCLGRFGFCRAAGIPSPALSFFDEFFLKVELLLVANRASPVAVKTCRPVRINRPPALWTFFAGFAQIRNPYVIIIHHSLPDIRFWRVFSQVSAEAAK